MMLSNVSPFLILVGIAVGPIIVPFVVAVIITMVTDAKKGPSNDTRSS